MPVIGTTVYLDLTASRPVDLPRTLGHLPFNPILDNSSDLVDAPEIMLRGLAENFGNRSTGAKVRNVLWNALHAKKDNRRIRVVMSGIPVVSSSFADEAFGKLVEEIGLLDFSQSVELVDLNPLTKGIIEVAISQRIGYQGETARWRKHG